MMLRLTLVAVCGWLVASLTLAEEIVDPKLPVTKVASDCKFTEGPVVDPQGNVYFSDGRNDRVMQLDKDGKLSVFLKPCGRANGLKFDAQGRLCMCQSVGAGGKQRVARIEKDGAETPLAETYEGLRLNAPNDLTIDRQGRIYFTDINLGDAAPKSDLPSGVYRIDAPGKFVRVISGLLRPNGIVITPDNKTLYVSDRGTQKLHRYRVKPDGGLEPDGIVYDFSPDRGIDGMCLDLEGNIYGAAGEKEKTGLWVISPEGKLLLHKPMPEFSTNVAFGGDDMRDLYLTALTSVYKLRTNKAGAKLVGQEAPESETQATLPVDDPRRPPAITTQDVPVVTEAMYAGLRQYQNTRTAEFRGWDPSGQGMLIRTRFGNSSQLHQVYEPGGRREQLTFFDEPATGEFIPQAKDGSFLVLMSHGGNENDQVYYHDRPGFRTQLITDGKSRNLLGPVRENGSQMIVLSNQRNGRDTDIYVADCRKPKSLELLMPVEGQFWNVSDWSQDGKQLLLFQYVSINECYPAVFDVGARKLTRLPLPAKGKAAVGTMKFTPDGRSAYVTTDAEGEFLALYTLDLATQKYTPLVKDIPWDIVSVEVEPKSGQVAFTSNEDGANRLYLLKSGKPQAIDLPLATLGTLEFSPDGKQLGFTLSRPDAPADAYSISLDDSKQAPTRWTYSEVGGLNPDSFVKPERISFSSFDGRQIPAYYFRPRKAQPGSPVGVVVQIHGGPESQYRPDFAGVIQYYVNELGLAVIAPNVRGSAGYGKTYLLLDNGPKRLDSVRDIGALLDWIATRPELDKSRVAVTGGSYGGFMVLASLVHHGDRLRAGIDNVGIANFITLLERTSPYRQDLRRAEYGDERAPQMRAVFEQISPIAGAHLIRSALLVAHGTNDPRVPFSEAEQIVAKVRGAGRTVWTVYANNEGHGFAKKDNRDYLTAVEATFLAKELKE